MLANSNKNQNDLILLSVCSVLQNGDFLKRFKKYCNMLLKRNAKAKTISMCCNTSNIQKFLLNESVTFQFDLKQSEHKHTSNRYTHY